MTTSKLTNYFTEDELSCPCCGVNGFNPETLAKFNSMRAEAGFAIPMSSGYRCPKYNDYIGATQTHATGQAGDVVVSHVRAYTLLAIAAKHGFTGIGVSQKGDTSKRFLHLDDLMSASGRPRPHLWSY